MLPPLKYRQKQYSTRNRPRSIPGKVLIAFQNGRYSVAGLGVWHAYWRDPYHLLLTLPWPAFLMVMVGFYGVINTLFALAYLAGGNGIANAKPGSFLDAFFFSVQTLASIGYGAMYPTSTYAHALVALEAITSIIGIALMTGLVFARFSQSTARVMFTRVAVITPYNDIPTLMLRTANQRRNQILEAKLRLYLLRDEVSVEGEFMRRVYPLRLLRDHTPAFTLTWTAMHPIDEQSPLYGATPHSLEVTKTTLLASLTGIDETVSQAMHARHSYAAHEILWNQRFVNIIHKAADGHRYVDYAHFHDVIQDADLDEAIELEIRNSVP